MKNYYLTKIFGTVFGAKGILHAAPIIAGSAAATVMTMTSLVSNDPSIEEDPLLSAQQMQVHEQRISTLENLQAKINKQQNRLSDREFERHAAPADPEKEKLYEAAKSDMLGLQTQITNLKSAFAKGIILDPHLSEVQAQYLANRFERSFGGDGTGLSTFAVTKPMTPNNHGFSYLQECRITTSGSIEAMDQCMSAKASINDFTVFATGTLSLIFGAGGGVFLLAAGNRARDLAEKEAKRREEEKSTGEKYTSINQKIVVKEVKR